MAASAAGVAALVVGLLGVGAQAEARPPAASYRAALGTVTATPTTTPPAPPAPTPLPTDVGPSPLLPNLRSRLASDVHVVGHGAVRRLRFGSTLANVGARPHEVVPRPREDCAAGERGVAQAVYQDANGNAAFSRSRDTVRVFRRAGCMHFHPQHNHWHVDASARYWLTRAGDPATVLARHRKVSFCLRDSRQVRPDAGRAFYGACSRDRRQGVTIGWGDLYQSFLPGQSVRLPARARAGTYCLWQQADPLGVLRESDETDNVSVRAIRLSRRDEVRYLPDNRRCVPVA